MFNIRWIERNTTRQQWRETWRPILRKCGDWPKVRQDERVELATTIAECAEDGQVALNIHARDCDCVEYECSRLIQATPVAVYAAMLDEVANAEGPMHLSVSKPSDRLTYSSRDLALEAFENGHPYHITGATI